ncbi:hypothetical protein CC1G_10198 [Coprinopsis cinerea okayama7|uniref:DUF6534 domain-containing protein n=1 Tax=Coprinopsis cinerea (strain Okayama-7 / 130 / ATCC MYA-4618 / FGSC 9003) TaxID=240176 RepID=A8PGF0_COPC7|nr:hypothetical protein CC1G_10198 [Coprinopsis cinerea okayama7\|eukprot:XP_001841201.2 hypothetical protein CC1G_10198 [Coprinopsis cinerea okayama7\
MASGLPPNFLYSTVGAVSIGSQVSMFLFGIASLQTYMYYQRFRDDKWYLRLTVAALWVLQLGHSVCVVGEVYKATVVDWGDRTALSRLPSPFLKSAIAAAATITWIAHTFYAWRAWCLLPGLWRYLGPFAVLVTTLRFAGSTVVAVKYFQSRSHFEAMAAWGWLVKTIIAAGAVIDLMLAVAMVYFLHLQRRRILKRSMRFITRLMHYTIGTGLLTSMAAIAFVIGMSIEKRTTYWVAIFTCHAKLYSNSVLASLNSREALRAMWREWETMGDLSATPGVISETQLQAVAPRKSISNDVTFITTAMKTSSRTSNSNVDDRASMGYQDEFGDLDTKPPTMRGGDD